MSERYNTHNKTKRKQTCTHEHPHRVQVNIVTQKIFALFISTCLIFVVIYYLGFQEAVEICYCINLLKLNFECLIFALSFNRKLLMTEKVSRITVHTKWNIQNSINEINRKWFERLYVCTGTALHSKTFPSGLNNLLINGIFQVHLSQLQKMWNNIDLEICAILQ